jgi:phosphoglycerate dehydrogenase-like enzyme
MKNSLQKIGIALVGLGVVGAFVMTRAASFNQMNVLLHSATLPLDLSAELGGLVLILLHAAFAISSRT